MVSEILAWDDADIFMSETADPSVQLLQDLYHRLIAASGSNLDDPDRGLGLVDALSGAVDQTLANRIDSEFLKDDRVQASKTTITLVSVGSYLIEIQILANGAALGLVIQTDGTAVVRIA